MKLTITFEKTTTGYLGQGKVSNVDKLPEFSCAVVVQPSGKNHEFDCMFGYRYLTKEQTRNLVAQIKTEFKNFLAQ